MNGARVFLDTNVLAPEISPNFTVEDIHKIREWNYECCKDMAFEEYQEYLKENTQDICRKLEKLKAEKVGGIGIP